MEFKKNIWIILAIIVGVLLILIPLLAWVGGDGMEATFEALGLPVPPSLFPRIDLGIWQDYIFGALGVAGIFCLATGVFYLFSKTKKNQAEQEQI